MELKFRNDGFFKGEEKRRNWGESHGTRRDHQLPKLTPGSVSNPDHTAPLKINRSAPLKINETSVSFENNNNTL